MKTVAFIPIKLNSQRLPHKNILPLGDKPLCRYIAEVALSCREIDEVYVYCSDDTVMEYMPDGIIFLKRSSTLDQDSTKGMQIYSSFMKEVDADIYVLMHTTSPFLKSKSVDHALMKMKCEGFDSAFSAEAIQTFVWFDEKPLNYSLDDVPRTQDIKPIFVETSGFYAFAKSVLLGGNRIGCNPYIEIVDYAEAIDIDTREDFNHAIAILKSISDIS